MSEDTSFAAGMRAQLTGDGLIHVNQDTWKPWGTSLRYALADVMSVSDPFRPAALPFLTRAAILTVVGFAGVALGASPQWSLPDWVLLVGIGVLFLGLTQLKALGERRWSITVTLREGAHGLSSTSSPVKLSSAGLSIRVEAAKEEAAAKAAHALRSHLAQAPTVAH